MAGSSPLLSGSRPETAKARPVTLRKYHPGLSFADLIREPRVGRSRTWIAGSRPAMAKLLKTRSLYQISKDVTHGLPSPKRRFGSAQAGRFFETRSSNAPQNEDRRIISMSYLMLRNGLRPRLEAWPLGDSLRDLVLHPFRPSLSPFSRDMAPLSI